MIKKIVKVFLESLVLLLCAVSLAFGFPLELPFSFEIDHESIRVVDGDTLVMDLEPSTLFKILGHPEIKDYLTVSELQRVLKKKKMSIRLAQIDAPERAQEFGEVSKQFLNRLIARGGPVKFQVTALDKYERLVAEVYQREEWLNKTIVSAGSAWVYPEYRNDISLDQEESTARKNKGGLWQLQNPIRPSLWRHHRRPQKPLPSFVGKVRKITALPLIQVERENGGVTWVQFSDIRLPKPKQPYAHESERALRTLLPIGSSVTVQVIYEIEEDPSNIFGVLIYPPFEKGGQGGFSINQQLVQAGWAFPHPRYATDLKLYALQKEAQVQKRGLWQKEYQEHPWREWVKEERPEKDRLLLQFF